MARPNLRENNAIETLTAALNPPVDGALTASIIAGQMAAETRAAPPPSTVTSRS